VYVTAWSSEDDSPLADENAEGEETLRLPEGPAESVVPTPFMLSLAPLWDDDLECIVHGTYSVTYS
jgi:hypothetical protein